MSYATPIDEKVKVWALFDSSNTYSSILPVAMDWKSQVIKFKKLVFISSKRIGENRVITLTCASDGANFELEYNNSSQVWKLKKIMPTE